MLIFQKMVKNTPPPLLGILGLKILFPPWVY